MMRRATPRRTPTEEAQGLDNVYYHGQFLASQEERETRIDEGTHMPEPTPAELVASEPFAACRRAVQRDLDDRALSVARRVVEDVLVRFRDDRISTSSGNGLVIRDADGRLSSITRLSTRDGLEIGIAAYLAAIQALETEPGRPVADEEMGMANPTQHLPYEVVVENENGVLARWRTHAVPYLKGDLVFLDDESVWVIADRTWQGPTKLILRVESE
jgi:hypothetical protein